MKFGLCFDAKNAIDDFPTQADYLEVSGMLVNKFDDETFGRLKNAVECGRLKTYSCNGLIDSAIRLVGDNVDFGKIKDYCDRLFLRLAELNVKYLVFGSGKARNIPEGFSREAAEEQLLELADILADKAAPYGQVIAVETLSYNECNVLNTLDEGAGYVKAVNRDNFRLLVDFFHFDSNGEDFDSIRRNKDILVHAHFCAPKTRTVPVTAEEWEFFEKCMQSLTDIGYTGNVSFEGIKPGNPELDLMLAEMKKRFANLTK